MTSYPPPYPSSTPPPPPPLGAFEQQDVPCPPVAWVLPVAAVLAVVGVFTPWFHGSVSIPGQGSKDFEDSLYSFADGRIGLLPPIALVALAVGAVGLLRGRIPRRFSRGSSGPVVSAARGALIVGAVTLVCVVIAWFLVPSQYKFDDGNGGKVSWNTALDEIHRTNPDASFSRGPQIGYFLTIAAGVLALVAGVLMLLMRSKTQGDQPVPQAAFPPPGGPAQYAPSYGPPQQGQWNQPSQYGPPPQQGQWNQPPQYGPPPQQGQWHQPPPSYGPPSTYGTPAPEQPSAPPDLTK